MLYDRLKDKPDVKPATREAAQPLDLPTPYLLFLGDAADAGYAKTAFGLRDWAPHKCVGEYALPSATVTTALPALSPAEAVG